MNIRNNLIDRLEKDSDGNAYSLSIGLKSGEIVYIDGISKGEKNGYLNFAKHSADTMILEIDNSLWRIQAVDIESISVKQYKSEHDKKYGWFYKILLSKGRFGKDTYFFWLKWFIFALVLSVFFAAVKTVLAGDIMTVIMDPTLMGNIIKKTFSYAGMAFNLILFIMIGLYVVDIFLPTTEPYRRIKPHSEYLKDSRLSNLIVIVSFVFAYGIFSMIASKIF